MYMLRDVVQTNIQVHPEMLGSLADFDILSFIMSHSLYTENDGSRP